LKNGVSNKRNDIIFQKKVAALVHNQQIDSELNSESTGNSNSSPTDSKSPLGTSEFEYSENSDVECIERIERIRVKTTINTSRIPSMCIITPTPSDDESTKQKAEDVKNENPNEVTIRIKNNDLKLNKQTGYATVLSTSNSSSPEYKKEHQHQIIKKATLLPLNNVFNRLKGVLMKSSNKENFQPESEYDIPVSDSDAGEYVTIKDVNNKKPNPSSGVYYSNDVVKRNLATVLTGNLNDETEYVSLNELPCNIRCESHLLVDSKSSDENISTEVKKININVEYDNVDGEKDYNKKLRGARVVLDAQGKVVFSSDSLKRRNKTYTTFSPGPFVKENNSTTIVNENFGSPLLNNGIFNRKTEVVRPVQKSSQNNSLNNESEPNFQTQSSPLNSDAICNNNNPNLGVISQPNSGNMQQPTGSTFRGAYVNIQDAAPLRNGPPIYTPPGVYSEEGNKSIFIMIQVFFKLPLEKIQSCF
jgi:hypothetical protein